MRALVGVVAVAVASCEGVPEPLTAESRQEILGGSADAGASLFDVFLLGMTFGPDGGSTICSAARIGPRTLVTAAHCIDPVRRGAASVSVVAFNKPTDVGLTGSDLHRMTEYRLHPMWNPAVESASYDIAMVLLDRVPDATWREISRVAPATGQGITLAGFGRDNPADGNSSGTRRAVAATITAVANESFGFGTSGTLGICGGDSGGPTLRVFADQVERVVGLHSVTPDSAVCGDGTDTRIDFHAAFIDGFLMQKDPLPARDAGVAVTDAGIPDAGGPIPDAGAPLPPDAGAMTMDAGAGGGTEPPQGCGCTSSALPFVFAALLLFVRSGVRVRRLDSRA